MVSRAPPKIFLELHVSDISKKNDMFTGNS